NASCSFCDIWEKPSPYVTLESASCNFRDMKRLGVKVIDFTGGEPLLHRQIDELLVMAKEFGFITTLTTNALLYPKWADRLKGKVDMLHFSLDSADQEKHDSMRGVACYDKVMESIAIAHELGERPDILFTVFEENLHEIKEVYEQVSFPNDLMLLLNPVFDYNDVSTGGSLSTHSLASLKQWGKKKLVYINEAFLTLRQDGGNHVSSPVCRAGSTTLVISPENKLILPCYHLGVKEFPVENRLYDLYNSDEVQKQIASEGSLPACEGCVINCYMQPSFAVEVNKYFWKALKSTFKYNMAKGTFKHLSLRR
ncbi:MAG: radical SAM protein, partial [Cyclobacteriaceae bacterium]